VVLWRISNHVSLAGDAGMRASGRWHTRGRRIVYCAESPAAALLKTLAHLELDLDSLPRRYRRLKLAVPDDMPVERLGTTALAADWVERADVTRALGDAWLRRGNSPLLSVPSALVPETFNVLLNPAQPGASRVVVVSVGEHTVDARLRR